ncbi:hypothetical protein QQF64_019143 [Cirrhinus molitorella]|uniref:Uncharacterized protein n=1 Tax=Cirrhinus molitorella TaxID=172907 RepID=A0ABR3LEM6_9TELE
MVKDTEREKEREREREREREFVCSPPWFSQSSPGVLCIQTWLQQLMGDHSQSGLFDPCRCLGDVVRCA